MMPRETVQIPKVSGRWVIVSNPAPAMTPASSSGVANVSIERGRYR